MYVFNLILFHMLTFVFIFIFAFIFIFYLHSLFAFVTVFIAQKKAFCFDNLQFVIRSTYVDVSSGQSLKQLVLVSSIRYQYIGVCLGKHCSCLQSLFG